MRVEDIRQAVLSILAEGRTFDRDSAVISILPKLSEPVSGQELLENTIDQMLSEEAIYLNFQDRLSQTNCIPTINFFQLKKRLTTVGKEKEYAKYLKAARLALEVDFLLSQAIGPLLEKRVATNEQFVRKTCPSIRHYSTLPSPDFFISIYLKAFLFSHRAFVDLLLSLLNQLNFILAKSPDQRGEQPAKKLDRFLEQYLTGKIDHLDDSLLHLLNEEIADLLSARFIRNNLKLGADFEYFYEYSEGNSRILGIMIPVQKNDALIERLIALGLLQSSPGIPVGLERVKTDLLASLPIHRDSLLRFLTVIFETVCRNVKIQ